MNDNTKNNGSVIPAKAGIQNSQILDPRLRGDDNRLDGLPTYPEMRPLQLTDYHFVAPTLKEHPLNISDCNFTNIYAWREAYQYKISQMNEMVIVRGLVEKSSFLLPPIGDQKKSVKTVVDLFQASPDENFPCLAVAPQWLADELAKDLKIEVSDEREDWDYVYKSSDLAELPGQKYHAKKNLIRQFLSQYEPTIEELDTKTCAEAMEFSDRWCEQRNCDSDDGLGKEKCAIYQMLTHFEALRLHGIVVRVKGEIVALSMGEELDNETYIDHVEKGDSHMKGIYQFVNHEVAKLIAPRYKWINREQDMGVLGLRRAKMSYHPDHIVKKFRVDHLR